MLRVSVDEYINRLNKSGLKQGFILEPEYENGVLSSVIPLEAPVSIALFILLASNSLLIDTN